MIWIPSDTDAWEAVKVIDNDFKTITVKLKDDKEFKILGNIKNFDSLEQESLNKEYDNLVESESFCEGIILHHTKKRFYNDNIYTYVGNILIALNPYKYIDMYNPQLVNTIFQQTKLSERVAPHVFSIGATAVINMRNDCKDQSILISGKYK
jgi:myosin heavy subunit